MFIQEVVGALEELKVKYAIIGGYALAMHGIIRSTVDVDLVIQLTEKDLTAAQLAFAKIGLTSQLPLKAKDIANFRLEYIANRNLKAWSFVDYSNPLRVVDILLTKSVKDIKIVKKSLGGKKINVASLQDLLKLKQAAGREQDLLDIKSIKEVLNEKNKS